MSESREATFDYVVVGSGAGGGPVAANLASAGFKVLLIEAGSEYHDLNYDVPAFHAQASQDPEMSWEFYVKHYEDPKRNTSQYDSKYVSGKGVLYPRAGTLGGCTGHHALITIYPHNIDWVETAAIAKADDPNDATWAPDRMRRLFERIERCGYLGRPVGADNPTRHGYDGWLSTDVITDLIDPETLLKSPDFELIQTVLGAVQATIWDLEFDPLDPASFDRILDQIESTLENAPSLKDLFRIRSFGQDKLALEVHLKDKVNRFLDPNQYQVTVEGREGVFLIPLSVSRDHRTRVGSRDRINQVRKGFPQNLTVWCDTFVTRVVFEGKRAVGVEYVKRAKFYEAVPESHRNRDPVANRERVRVRREVIVSGGTFNTPQLLMLSGIGPKAHLAEIGIQGEDFVVDLPAVGRYLQDRYEVGLISEAPVDFKILGNARFRKPKKGEEPDDALVQWKQKHEGLYATNGAVISILRKSSPSLSEPDLFIFGLPAAFKGYFPGYADYLETRRNRFTWAILKGHTKNTGGYVRLRSKDPRERPEINFKYFDEGTDREGDDLHAMLEGIHFVRRFTSHLGVNARPLVKDLKRAPDMNDRFQLAEWVKREAWGHHACGTCRIGPRDDREESVLDTHFRVKGVEGLRVVDASVFRQIPGLFIVTPIYMIAEKASESILRDAGWRGGAGDLNLPKIG